MLPGEDWCVPIPTQQKTVLWVVAEAVCDIIPDLRPQGGVCCRAGARVVDGDDVEGVVPRDVYGCMEQVAMEGMGGGVVGEEVGGGVGFVHSEEDASPFAVWACPALASLHLGAGVGGFECEVLVETRFQPGCRVFVGIQVGLCDDHDRWVYLREELVYPMLVEVETVNVPCNRCEVGQWGWSLVRRGCRGEVMSVAAEVELS